MRATGRLLQSCRITLFTREHCGLCTEAKAVLSKVQSVRPFEFREVDIIDPGAKGWRDLYDFDVPVIHISKSDRPQEEPKLASAAVKLMHRFTDDQVKAKIDSLEAL